MDFKVIIDIQDQTIASFVATKLMNQINNLNLISYQDNYATAIIFKELQSLSDLKKFHIKETKNHTVVIITDNQELMFLALDLYPLSFIRKTDLDNDLAKTISLILNINKDIEQVLTFKIGHSYIQIKTNKIIWIESFGHYLYIHTKTGEYKVREKIGNILEKIDTSKFIRVHKSYIVNRDYILKRSTNEIELISHDIIPIGRKYK